MLGLERNWLHRRLIEEEREYCSVVEDRAIRSHPRLLDTLPLQTMPVYAFSQ